MYELLKKYGYRSFMAPDKEEGAGDADTGKGDGNVDAGDKGEKKEEPKTRVSEADGLLGTRKKAEEDGGKKEEDQKTVDDGRPKGLAEQFWDAEKKVIKTDALIKSQLDTKAAYDKLKRDKGIATDVPEDAADYFKDGIELPAEVDRLALEGPDDPGLKAFGKVALKYGLGKETAKNIVRDMMVEMNEQAEAPIDPEQERAALGDGAEELIDGVYVWLEGMEKQGKFGESDIEHAIGLSRTASGIRFLAKMRGMTGETPIPLGLPQGSRGMSQEDWHTEMREAVKAKDYKRQQELDDIGEKIFGTEAASGSPIKGIPNQKDVDRHAKK